VRRWTHLDVGDVDDFDGHRVGGELYIVSESYKCKALSASWVKPAALRPVRCTRLYSIRLPRRTVAMSIPVLGYAIFNNSDAVNCIVIGDFNCQQASSFILYLQFGSDINLILSDINKLTDDTL